MHRHHEESIKKMEVRCRESGMESPSNPKPRKIKKVYYKNGSGGSRTRVPIRET